MRAGILGESGKFSNPPFLTDIQSLIFEKNDIETMKKCVVRNCDLKMSVGMIKQFQSQIDWSSSDYQPQATKLFQQILFDYVNDYSIRGNEALIQLDDKQKAVRLDLDYQDLLNRPLFINEFAPELVEYLDQFPRAAPSGTENEFFWSKIRFGLKPIVTLTHTAVYQRQNGNYPQFFIAAKQIYASRYIDSSLAFTILLRFSGKDNSVETYLLFTNRSRSDALDGMFSDFKRNIIAQEGQDRAQKLLEQAKSRIESKSKAQPETAQPTNENNLSGQIRKLMQNTVIRIILFIVLVLILFLLYRQWKIIRR